MAEPEEQQSQAPLPSNSERPWWEQACRYVLAGLRICRKDIPGILTLVGLFSLPPLAAVVIGGHPGAVAYWLASALPWITITLGNISMVLAIEALDAGKPVIPAQILPAAIRWFPRYIWTNGITTFLFWGLFTPLQWLIGQEANRLNWPSYAPVLLLLIPMLVWHVHLVFATYAAIVDNHPGVRSVMISIDVTRRRWLMIAAAFVGSVLVEAPIVGPLYMLILTVSNPVVAGGFTWMLIMFMRPIFIATLHEIYEDFRPALPTTTPFLGSPRTRIFHMVYREVAFRELPAPRRATTGSLPLRSRGDKLTGLASRLAELVPAAAQRVRRP